ncbi:MAG: ABC transporter permease [Oscillospiraceae bacterium]|nr:ABC transporter permease [Oscillospiraceae bacterium]
MAKTDKKHTPLLHIVKRDQGTLTWQYKILIRAIAIALALLVSGLLITALADTDPIKVYKSMISGVFGTERRRWNAAQGMAMLLCVSLAVTPAFKMKFWNIGAEGQALVGGLACAAVMFFLGESLPLPLLLVVMIVASVVAGMIWAVLPAIFKAFWNTNETLFTLMMNYVATQLVAWFLKQYVESGSGVMDIMPQYGLPVIGEYKYLLNVLIVALLTLLVYIYLKYSKHGYEISVVGESENTARYIGINVKKVIIRTLLISGALCGVAGLLLVGGTNHTISTTTVGGRGFTAIMVSWLAKFNPLFMVLTTFLIIFLELGSKQLTSDFGISSSIADISTGIILLFIIGCEFFLQYRIVLNRNRKEATK